MVAFYNVRLLDEVTDSPGALFAADGKIRAVFMGYFTNQSTVAQAANAILAEDGYVDKDIEYVDGKGLTLSPAFIDLHTHLRYPGQEQKEDLKSALQAAAAGGYCTVVAMPNTKPVVSSQAMAKAVVKEAARFSPVKVIQAVSITRDFGEQDTSHLDKLNAKVVPLITQDGRDVEDAAVLLDAMCKATKRGIVVSCHSEDMSLARSAAALRKEALRLMAKNDLGPCGTEGFSFCFPITGQRDGEKKSDSKMKENTIGDDDSGEGDEEEYKDEDAYDEMNALLATSDTMLSIAEASAVTRNLMISQAAMCHVHIAHVSTARAIDAVRQAKASIQGEEETNATITAGDALDALLGEEEIDDEEEDEDEVLSPSQSWSVTCEVTPHHIALSGSVEPFNRAIVNPPLGTEEDRMALLEGIRDGTVDAIATDHAPHTASDKADGAAGFVGLETAYAVCNTVLCSPEKTKMENGQISEKRLSSLMSASPARILHLNKGLLASGYDADLVLLDSEEIWTIDSKVFYSKGRATPFNGMEVVGKVKGLYIGGKLFTLQTAEHNGK